MKDIQNESSLIMEVLEIKAYEYLEEKLIESMKNDMKSIAQEAVKQWAEVRLQNSPEMSLANVNINVSFIEHIVKTVSVENRIKINVK